MPDLATTQGQAVIEPLLHDRELIILDNISTLFPSLKENDADSWAPIQTWLLKQRRAGRSVLLIHHTGKNGEQRGSSRKEDIMDCVLSLKRDKNYTAKEGATFFVNFTKQRHLIGEDLESMKLTLCTVDGTSLWKITSAEDEKYLNFCEMIKEDESKETIMEELDISRPTYYRYRKKYKQ